MKPFSIPPGEIQQRQLNLQQQLQNNDLGGVLIVQRVDLMYYAGIENVFTVTF